MKKNLIVVTGGAGFIGRNLIERLLKENNIKIISIDNYSSGSKKNHIINKKVSYINGETININQILKNKKKYIKSVFHFGEFSRIYQSFLNYDECYLSNSIGSSAVFKFCYENKIKLIYSATSATIGNKGEDKNLSPYSFYKAKNLELLQNLKKWKNFKFEVIYFYNVYGKNHIRKGKMATVIGIFENQFLNKKPLTVVKPGSQTRMFTSINDTIKLCIYAWKKNKCAHYSISSKYSYSILDIAKLFSKKIVFLPQRPGERYRSKVKKKINGIKIINKFGKDDIKKYIKDFIKNS